MFYTYILKSKKDKKLYTGFTENLKLRFEQHNKGLVESTRNRKPFSLIYYEACLNRKDATRREKYLKTAYGKKFIKNRIKSYFTGLITLVLSFCFALPVYAAPSISGISGTFSSGQSITISGSDFGSHPDYSPNHNYLPRFFDDFESGSLNYSANNWDNGGEAVGASINTSNNRPGSGTYCVKQGTNGGGIGHSADLSKSAIYMAAWRWVGLCSMESDGSNWKFFRVYSLCGSENCSPDYLHMLIDGEISQGTVHWYLEGPNDPGDWADYGGSGYLQSWHLYELYVDKNYGVKFWIDGNIREDYQTTSWSTWTPYGAYFDSFHRNDYGDPESYIYTDDAYIDHTQARVVLSNYSTWSQSRVGQHYEIQIPTSWSATSVTVNARPGTFADGSIEYLYVIKSDGTVNTNGYSVTVGSSGGGDTTAPASPSGLSIS